MIVKEYLDPEIYYIKNILSEEDLKTLQEFVKNDETWFRCSHEYSIATVYVIYIYVFHNNRDFHSVS